jgi:F0F1-type ATP synthase delta subunit
MRPTLSQYALALEALSKEGVSPSVVAQNFLGLLARRGESKKLASITTLLEERDKKHRGVLAVTMVTASEVTPETSAMLKEKAEQVFPGQIIEFHRVVDRSVVGGVSFQTSEALYDATFAASLKELRRSVQ